MSEEETKQPEAEEIVTEVVAETEETVAPEDTDEGDEVVDLEKDETEKMKVATGIKDKAANMTGIAQAKDNEEESQDSESYPSLFISGDERIRVEVAILFDPKNLRPLMMVSSPLLSQSTTNLNYLRRIVVWAEFNHPTYEDIAAYRSTSMVYDGATGQYLTDPVKMRACFIRHHLIEWDVKDKSGKVVELEREDGILTDGSMARVGQITPSLIDILLTEFEKEALLNASTS